MSLMRFGFSNKVAAVDGDDSNVEEYYEANTHDSESNEDHHIRDLYLFDDTSTLAIQQVPHETLLEQIYASITRGDTASIREIVRQDVSILNNVRDFKFRMNALIHVPDATSNDLSPLHCSCRLVIRLYRCSMAGKFMCAMSQFFLAHLLGIYYMKTKLSSLVR